MSTNYEYGRQHYLDNKQEYLDRAKSWQKDHAVRAAELGRIRRNKARMEAIDALGGKCARCGFSDHRALQIDHVNGDANSESRYRANSSKQYYRKVATNAEGRYQVLCANCNWIKRFENNEHGHT